MRLPFFSLLGGLLTGLAPLSAQVVQLPTLHQTTVSTTVSVPDGGGTSLARVPTGRWQRSTRSLPGIGHLPGAGSLFQQRFVSRGASLSQVHLRATLIDHREWDEAIRAAGRGRGTAVAGTAPDPITQRAQFLTRHMGRSEPNRTAAGEPRRVPAGAVAR